MLVGDESQAGAGQTLGALVEGSAVGVEDKEHKSQVVEAEEDLDELAMLGNVNTIRSHVWVPPWMASVGVHSQLTVQHVQENNGEHEYKKMNFT